MSLRIREFSKISSFKNLLTGFKALTQRIFQLFLSLSLSLYIYIDFEIFLPYERSFYPLSTISSSGRISKNVAFPTRGKEVRSKIEASTGKTMLAGISRRLVFRVSFPAAFRKGQRQTESRSSYRLPSRGMASR